VRYEHAETCLLQHKCFRVVWDKLSIVVDGVQSVQYFIMTAKQFATVYVLFRARGAILLAPGRERREEMILMYIDSFRSVLFRTVILRLRYIERISTTQHDFDLSHDSKALLSLSRFSHIIFVFFIKQRFEQYQIKFISGVIDDEVS